jgi:hypothetical protein
MRGDADPLERLRRWRLAGGQWHVTALGDSSASVALERCDLGEAVDSITSGEPDFIEYLKAHPHGSA